MEERGTHSWGFTDGNEVWKNVGAFSDSFTADLLGKKIALVHTRFATFGSKTEENSHPFRVGNILGVHNGQIYNHAAVAKTHGIEYAVDSELIFHYLNEGRDLSELEGYGAVVFFENNILHLGVFNKGQLTLAATEFGWAWASTKSAVANSLRMAGFTPHWYAQLEEGTLYQLDGWNIKVDERPLSISERVVQTYNYRARRWNPDTKTWEDDTTPKVNSAGLVTHGHYGYGHFDDDYNWDWLEDKGKETQKLLNEPSSDDDEPVDVETIPDDCNFCGESMANGFGKSKQWGYICKACLDSEPDDLEEDEDEYFFSQYEADKLWKILGDDGAGLRAIMCSDCNYWSIADEKVYREHRHRFNVCESCYEINYKHSDLALEFEQDHDQPEPEAAVIPA
jgi:hypothetical protein